MRHTLLRAAAALAVLAASLGLSAPATAAPEGTTAMRVVLDPMPAQVSYGDTLQFSGRIQYLIGDTWRYPGDYQTDVRLETPDGEVYPDLDAAGGFSLRYEITAPYTFLAEGWSGGTTDHPGMFWAAPVEHRVTLKPEAYITFARMTYDAFGRLEANYCTGTRTGGPAPAGPVYLQYSADGRTGWATKATGKRGCQWVAATWPRSGYWRLKSKADAVYPSAVSTVRRALRWRTEINKIKVSPRKTDVGKKVTVTGRLTRYAEGRKNKFGYPDRQIQVIFHCKGKKNWWLSAKGRTDKRGHFKIKAKTYCDSSFAAEFRGGSDTFATGSTNEVYVETYGAPLTTGRMLPATPPTVSLG
ncbi:hypothetical protein EDD29_7485 [Actinocorallia herbida]|uniref:Uncharacterized protein n=1 Tax=Actinocorallia herbida TaxID=58109 RepID=A0A3N1D8A6_9ACTN|nr:hypothetical protein [Actinocorallia herbida]ROO89777.1 hypothetical protein EDD29_7485 [Actinocorallia herbida]